MLEGANILCHSDGGGVEFLHQVLHQFKHHGVKSSAGEEDAEDQEDFMIRGTDNLIVAGHVEGDSSTLEVYVYNDVEDALYVHHDILLQSFPLALEWISYDPENDKKGSLVAVGTMEPIIEVIDNEFTVRMRPSNSF